MDTKGRFKAKSFVNEDFFSSMTHELAWVIGLLAADGHIEKSGRRVIISQSGEAGKEMMEHLARLIGWTGKIVCKKTSRQDAYEVRFTSAPVCTALANYGIVNGKTKTFTLPDIPTEFMSSFIRGYIDGDGSIGVYHVGKSKNFLILSVVGNDWLVRDFAQLVPSNNFVISQKRGVSEVRWNGQNAYLASHWVYQSSELPETKKSRIWREYERGLKDEPTRWANKYF